VIGGMKHRWRHKIKPPLNQIWRRATVAFRKQPDFVIIGVQGGGTTSMYSWLKSHPDFREAERKELRYFDRNYKKGPKWYRAQFPLARKGIITGEATPYTFMHPLAGERMARDLPASTVIIMMVRNPADRALSRYRRSLALGEETEDVERAFELEPERMEAALPLAITGQVTDHANLSYVSGGLYVTYLRQLQEHLGPNRVEVFELEDLVRSGETRNTLLARIGLSPHDEPFPYRNSFTQSQDDNADVKQRLEEYFRPYNEELFTMLGRRLWGQ
jgi:hypothetical protein